MKTTHWICDTCGNPIWNVKDGWVEWITITPADPMQRCGRNLRLVHHVSALPKNRSCQFNANAEFARDQGVIADDWLREFVGPDGLTRLLGMIVDGILPTEEVIRMIQRLHTPGYELARPYFKETIETGVIDPNLGKGFYRQEQIKEVLKEHVYPAQQQQRPKVPTPSPAPPRRLARQAVRK